MGVFAVDRGIFDHPMFAPEPYTEREAWLWLIGAAAWKATRVRCGRAVVDLQRGQLAFATRFMAVKWKWAESRVRRFLKRLETDAMVTLSATRETTRITICNYDKYAFGRRTDDAPVDAQTDAPPTHPRRKEEELNKDKKEEEGSKEETSLRSVAPAPTNVSRETKSEGKHLLPDDWLPKPDHYALARTKNMSDAAVTDAALEMRSWSKGNGEKRKNWDWVFNNWLTRNAKNGYRGSRPLQDDSKSSSAAAGRLAEAAGRGEYSFGPRPSLLPDPNESPVFLLSKG